MAAMLDFGSHLEFRCKNTYKTSIGCIYLHRALRYVKLVLKITNRDSNITIGWYFDQTFTQREIYNDLDLGKL